MKKDLKAFTLTEVLIVILIIGVIAALTIPSLGQKVDRNKGLFKKAYSLTERTVAELINDETYYPFDYDKFGFKKNNDVKIVGADYYTSTTNYGSKATTKYTGDLKKLVKFCNLFTNSLNLNGNPTFNGGANSATKCNFTTNDGITWIITDVDSGTDQGFLVEIDTNGDKNPNKPAYANLATEGNTGNRDRFYMKIRYDGKMEVPNTDAVALSFLKSTDLNREK